MTNAVRDTSAETPTTNQVLYVKVKKEEGAFRVGCTREPIAKQLLCLTGTTIVRHICPATLER